MVQSQGELVGLILRGVQGEPVLGLAAGNDLGGECRVAGLADKIGGIGAVDLEVDAGNGSRLLLSDVLAGRELGNVDVLVGVRVRSLGQGSDEAKPGEEGGGGGEGLHGERVCCEELDGVVMMVECVMVMVMIESWMDGRSAGSYIVLVSAGNNGDDGMCHGDRHLGARSRRGRTPIVESAQASRTLDSRIQLPRMTTESPAGRARQCAAPRSARRPAAESWWSGGQGASRAIQRGVEGRPRLDGRNAGCGFSYRKLFDSLAVLDAGIPL